MRRSSASWVLPWRSSLRVTIAPAAWRGECLTCGQGRGGGSGGTCLLNHSTRLILLLASRSTDLGAAYGTAKSGVGVSSMGVMKPDLVMKSIIPVVMAGVLGIYGLIIAVIIANGGKPCPARQPLHSTP